MNALAAANGAAQLLATEFTRLGLDDLDACGGVAIWSGRPLDGGAPYVSIQGAITAEHARLLAQAVSLMPPQPRRANAEPTQDLERPSLATFAAQ